MATHELPIFKDNVSLGNLRHFNRDTLGFLEHFTAQGDVVLVKFGPFAVYLLNHPDAVYEVLVAQAKKFHKSINIKLALDPVTGENIFTADGDYWRQSRKLMQPAFHTKRIGNYANEMVAQTQTMLASWRDQQQIPVDRAMTDLTMHIITKTMFNADMQDAATTGEAMSILFQVVSDRTSRLLQLPLWMPIQEHRQMRRAKQIIADFLVPLIAARRQSAEDYGDLLSMLLMAQDEQGHGMDDDQLLRELTTIFGAGHETTANTLMWTWYLLSQNPDAEAKLHEELDRVLQGRTPTLADLEHLPYTEMVIKEAMRLYPPAWGVSRGVVEPATVAGHDMAVGSTVIASIWTIHRDPRWWGSNALAFEPERFTPEREAKLPKYAYLPFGAGPRICIGNNFALMEARLILATIAQHYQLRLAPQQQVVPERVFVLRAKYGMNMIAQQRQPIYETSPIPSI